MAPQPQTRPALARSRDRALAMLGALAVMLGVIECGLLWGPPDRGLVDALLPAMFATYVAAGIVAWHRRPSNAMGALTLVAGLALYIGGIAGSGVTGLVEIGTIGATLIFPAIGHLLLAFPTGRLRSTPARAVVAGMYLLATIVEAPRYLFVPDVAPTLFIADLPQIAAIAAHLQSFGSFAVTAAASVILLHRLRRADARHRRVLAPLSLYGVVALLFIPFSAQVLEGVWGIDPGARFLLQALIITGVPIAFTAGMLTGGFARTGELAELASQLGDPGVRDSPETLLARTLGDPTLTVRFLGRDGDFVDARGAAVDAVGAGRGVRPILRDGEVIAEIDYDAGAVPDARTVDAAGRIVAIAVDRERLTAGLLATTAALRRSRERLVDAADAERQRIARDLHDGLQAQLVMLAVGAQQLASAPSSDVRERSTRLRADVDAAAGDLRRLVHDLLPAALIERGLIAAAEDLVDRMPTAVRFDTDVRDRELPPRIERTAYFVLAEALSNVVKHADATHVRVNIAHDHANVRVVVADDGRGGARFDSGLRGLRDRVDAVGGALTLTSSAGNGTTVTAELPCGS